MRNVHLTVHNSETVARIRTDLSTEPDRSMSDDQQKTQQQTKNTHGKNTKNEHLTTVADITYKTHDFDSNKSISPRY